MLNLRSIDEFMSASIKVYLIFTYFLLKHYIYETVSILRQKNVNINFTAEFQFLNRYIQYVQLLFAIYKITTSLTKS